jgi:hypothetical protein
MRNKLHQQFLLPRKIRLVIVFLLILVVSLPAMRYKPRQNPIPGVRNSETDYSAKKDTTIILHHTSVNILWPAGKINGFILVLPGWNFNRQDVCENSDFCKLAQQSGYCLILPEMGKSVYLFENFRETREDWINTLTLTWVIDTLIPYCQRNFNILTPGTKNFLFGISSGGRGVAQIAINTGSLFIAGAALSGDYDQAFQKDDKLMIGFLGPYEKFPSRWTGKDNPFMNAGKLKIPLFLGHGKLDKIVPAEQTIRFFERISSLNPDVGHVWHIDENGNHNYNYWNSEMLRIFAFFNEKGLFR